MTPISAQKQKQARTLSDRSANRLMLTIVLVAMFAELAYVVVNISAMPVYIKAIGLDPRWIGAMTTAYLFMEGLLKSPFGLLGDRVGRKILIVAGPAVSIFTALLTPFFTNPFALLTLRILDGLGAAALWPSAFSMIGDHVPVEKRAAAMSQFNLAYLFGLALGPAIGGLINDAAHTLFHVPLAESKQASFYVAALLFALTALLALTQLPNARASHHDPADLGPGVEGGFNFHDFKQMLGRMPAMLLFAFVTFFGVGLIMAYTKVFVLQAFHLSESRFGVLMLGPALIIGILSIWLGRLTDRVGKARAIRGGISLCAVAYWLLLMFPFQWSLVAFGSFIGLGFVVAFPAWMALVSEDCEPKLRGAAVGAVGTAQGLGALIGASLSAFLYKLPPVPLGPITIPEHGMPFVACGVMLALAALLALTTIHEPTACEK